MELITYKDPGQTWRMIYIGEPLTKHRMEKLIIIGSGSGGLPVASTVAKYKKDQYDIAVITKDSDIAYSPCGIPYVLKGDIPSYKDLIMQPEEHYRELGIKILTGTVVEEIDAQRKRIRCKNNWVEYDYLVIATGTAQRLPRVKGIELKGVFSAHIKTLKDAEQFEEYISTLQKPSRVILTGSGSIDLEFAIALKERGHEITIAGRSGHLMPDRLDIDMSEYVQSYLIDRGIRVMTWHELHEIIGKERIESISFGELTLPADVLLLGTDFMPEVTLAREAGFDTDGQGIKINEKGEVFSKGEIVKGVFASGACAHVINKATGRHDFMYTGSTSIQKSRVVAEQLLGKDTRISGSTNPRIAVLWDMHIGTVGLTSLEAAQKHIEVKVGFAEEKNTARYYPGGITVYLKLLFEKNTLRLIGAQIISEGYGIKERIDALSIAMSCGLTAKELAHLETAYSPPVSSLVDVMVKAANSVWMSGP